MPITLRDLAERQGEANFVWYGQDVRLLYRVEHITKEFRAESLRLMREGKRIQMRAEGLVSRITTVTAPDGTEEAVAEDEDAEKALEQLQADDQILKQQIDGIVIKIVDKWDVLGEDGQMLPLTMEAISGIPPDFERAVLEAIIEASSVGEANGRTSTKPLPFTLKQKAKPAPSRRHRSG